MAVDANTKLRAGRFVAPMDQQRLQLHVLETGVLRPARKLTELAPELSLTLSICALAHYPPPL